MKSQWEMLSEATSEINEKFLLGSESKALSLILDGPLPTIGPKGKLRFNKVSRFILHPCGPPCFVVSVER